MSNEDLIIAERSRDIGDFLVGRLLPFRSKRMVGPFIFIDHMGPTEVGPEKYFDIDQHPHIGLSTLTYLFEGEVMHADSLGSLQRIRPGSVNWMSAGKGVTHTERTPSDLRNGSKMRVHGYQIWVALPKELEEMDPEFHHIPEEDLPTWKDSGTRFQLVAGKAFGRTSPVPVHSELFMLDIRSESSYSLDLEGNIEGEVGICVVEGSIQACENELGPGNLLVAKDKDRCALEMKPGTHLLIFGGKPFSEERFIHWNFVSSSKERLEKAKAEWIDRQFPQVPNDDTYIPLPGH